MFNAPCNDEGNIDPSNSSWVQVGPKQIGIDFKPSTVSKNYQMRVKRHMVAGFKDSSRASDNSSTSQQRHYSQQKTLDLNLQGPLIKTGLSGSVSATSGVGPQKPVGKSSSYKPYEIQKFTPSSVCLNLQVQNPSEDKQSGSNYKSWSHRHYMKLHKGRSFRESYDSKRNGAELVGHGMQINPEVNADSSVPYPDQVVALKTDMDDLMMQSTQSQKQAQFKSMESLQHEKSDLNFPIASSIQQQSQMNTITSSRKNLRTQIPIEDIPEEQKESDYVPRQLIRYLNSKRFDNERKYSFLKKDYKETADEEGPTVDNTHGSTLCLQTDRMLAKLASILSENGGIGSSRMGKGGGETGLSKYTCASIHRLHEENRVVTCLKVAPLIMCRLHVRGSYFMKEKL
ncbi:hypothetical protein FGO68_gene5531 [Halteria grandinella]|uniref:Uncharacterized protein n=1 Tax=Halteria grandinella TaxID=5974 RepID=A0A8J8NXT5_HALGN|nr:hypothetical protein FGO68_gene5531 [Halteria grandinella]